MTQAHTDTGWIAVDLDGTLAEYHGWNGILHIGDPIPPMVERVQGWVKEGRRVKIFTARLAGERDRVEVRRAIDEWCTKHLGYTLEVTNIKDFGMYELWDDRAITVELNTGMIICHPYGQEDLP
jgi:hypothetical protein